MSNVFILGMARTWSLQGTVCAIRFSIHTKSTLKYKSLMLLGLAAAAAMATKDNENNKTENEDEPSDEPPKIKR